MRLSVEVSAGPGRLLSMRTLSVGVNSPVRLAAPSTALYSLTHSSPPSLSGLVGFFRLAEAPR